MKQFSFNSITKHADKLGYLAGVLASERNAIDNLTETVQRLIQGQVHSPNLVEIRNWVKSPYFESGVIAYIGGLVLEGTKLPIVGNIGKPLQRGAAAYLTAGSLIKLAYSMTHDPPQRSRGGNSGGGSVGNRGYS